MTKSTSFRLSDEALKQLSILSERFKKSQAAILEHLILDRSSSSDQLKNSLRRNLAWREYCNNHVLAREDPGDLWRAGYNRGWVDFQTRHGENDFIIPAPDESEK